jgi:hypothetical protein
MSANEIPLPIAFRHNQFDFKQVRRKGDIAIFEKSKPTHTYPSWEVVIVQHNEAREIAGIAIPARESMPWSESWGRLGWTDLTLEAAKIRFNALVNSRQDAVSRSDVVPR